jgi:hypothetical protein
MKWLLIIFLISQVFLYAARVPMHRALRSLGRALGGGMRLAARWCQGVSRNLNERGRELVLESGRETTEHGIEREFRRIEQTFAKDLVRVPELHRRLDRGGRREEGLSGVSGRDVEAARHPQLGALSLEGLEEHDEGGRVEL